MQSAGAAAPGCCHAANLRVCPLARQGLERMQSAGAAAREQVQRSASIVGASVHRMASHPATFRTTDSDLVRLTSML